MGDKDKRLEAELVFAQAIVEACEKLLKTYQQRIKELQNSEVKNDEHE